MNRTSQRLRALTAAIAAAILLLGDGAGLRPAGPGRLHRRHHPARRPARRAHPPGARRRQLRRPGPDRGAREGRLRRPLPRDPARATTSARSGASTTAAAASTSTACAATPTAAPPDRVVVIAKNRLTGGLAGALAHLRRHARGADHRPPDPAGAAAEGHSPAAAAHRRAGEGRARRLPRSPGRGRGLLRHRAPGEGRPGGLRGGARHRRPQPRRPHAPRQQAQPGLDGQDVHGGRDRPARGRGQALLPGPRLEVPRREGLDEGRPLEGARRAPAEPHLGPRLVLQRHLRAHGAPAAAEGRRLQAAGGRGDARLRARARSGSTATRASSSPGR